jgi:hypothetical protein
MANNLVSYNRFTALPANISTFGVSVEELKLQQGTPDANPQLSPMPQVAASSKLLAFERTGSDKTRVSEPPAIVVNPYEGLKRASVYMRTATQKMSSGLLGQMRSAIAQMNDPKLDASVVRVEAFTEFVKRQLSWTERIETEYLRSQSA